MVADRTLWVFISPLFKPAPGGAAMYNEVLARHFVTSGEQALFLVEQFPGQPSRQRIEGKSGCAEVRRLFPFRAGRSTRDLKSYLSYALQTIQMLALPGLIRRAVKDAGARDAVVIIHSSLFYKPSPLPMLLHRLTRVARQVRLVLDVRDPMFAARLAPTFRRFDDAIGCSLAISERLQTLIGETTRIHHIPVPFEPDPRSPDPSSRSSAAGGLDGVRYIFNPNGILDGKGYRLMIEVIQELRRRPGWEDIVLVTIGRARDRRESDAALERAGVTRYLGIVDNATSLAVAQGALLTMILSKNEGLPRSALESLALGKKTVVPRLAEFERTIPHAIARSDDATELADQIVELLDPGVTIAYPVERHSMAHLAASYEAFRPAGRGTTISGE